MFQIFSFFFACTPDKSPGDELDLIGLLITPDQMIISVGDSAQLKATGLTAGHESVDLTSSVDWSVERFSIAQISDSLDNEGVLSANGEGSTRIFASYGDIDSPYAEVIVTEAELERLTVSPNQLEIIEGDWVQMTATAYYSNGESGDVTAQSRWITENGSIIQFDAPGKVEAVGVGDTTIHAELDGISSDSVEIDVDPGSENAKADLRIMDVEGAISGGKAILSIKLKNQGLKGATGFWVDVFLDQSTQPEFNSLGTEYIWIDYLGPNHYRMLDVEIPVNNSSTDIWILADTNQDVVESHEANNTYDLSIDDGTPPPDPESPELEITFFDYYLNPAGGINYLIDVTNNGETTAPFFYVDLFTDLSEAPSLYDDGDKYVAIEDLAPGDTKYADIAFEENCFGCRSWVMVDGYEFIPELDENNNIVGPLLIEAD